jgi:Flp pilus assembly protein TadG
MAMALIPLAGMVGGGVDISRLYIVKTRLQHACDAGALAGRKTMGGGTWSQSNYAPRTAAEQFFDANYQADAYGATNRQRSFTESAGKVTGTASADLPMTLMKIFGRTSETLSVTCDAEMRLPNTDVMFVLDTTGSMDDKAVSTDSVNKISALKTAVKCFYEIVARLDTTETCTGGAPSGGTGDQVQIRFGFMPYATNVNVGKLLPTSYFANSWPYQSRQAEWTTSSSTSYPNPAVDSTGSNGSGTSGWGSWTTVSSNWFSCPSQPADQNNVTGTFTEDSSVSTDGAGVKTWTTKTYPKYNIDYETSWSGWNCALVKRYQGTGTYTTVLHTQTPVTTTTQTFNRWHYGQITQDISGLKNGTSWNNSFTLPIGTSGAAKTISWDGCIEERATTRTTNYSPIPSAAYDLNIDLVPNQATATSLWGPALPDVIYTRDMTYSGGWGGGWSGSFDSADAYTTTDYGNASSYYCPREARKLQTWTNASTFEAYVDSLTPDGNTYHDIGMLWGARFMSPDGIFASENAYTPQGGEIQRHMIFMTDGDTNTSNSDYNAYGVPWFDRRQTSASSAPSNSDLNDQVNARFLALCTAVKNKNITLWVISFGSGSNSTTESRLESCATSGRYFVARDAATLQNTFRSIADQISALRLTK